MPPAAHWVDLVHQPEWFSRPPAQTPGHSANGSVQTLGHTANGSRGSAAAGIVYADAFGVGTAAVAAAGDGAVESPHESAAAFQYDASDFMGGTPEASYGSLQPGTPLVAEAGQHSATSALTNADPSPVENEGAEEEDFQDLLAMLTM